MDDQLQRLVAQNWHHFKATGDPETRAWLIEHYLPLVGYVARRAVANAPAHQDRAEFESYGAFGLIDAVEKFDPEANVNASAANYSLGRAFESYAMQRIHGAILDGLRREDPLTRSMRKRVKEVEAAIALLEVQLGRHVVIADVAEHLGADAAEVRVVVQNMKSLNTSLEQVGSPGDDEGTSLADNLVDVRYDEPELHMEVRELQELLAVRLAGLGERDRIFAALYYCHQMSLTEIGSLLGISESRVGQIRLRVIHQLRSTPANARSEV